MFVEVGLSRKPYHQTNQYKQLYLCNSLLQRAKIDCYLDKESYPVTASCVEINLQELINNTVALLLTYLEEDLLTLNEEDWNILTMIYKWVCDGSQQAQFKKMFGSDSDSDGNIFQSSFVPL